MNDSLSSTDVLTVNRRIQNEVRTWNQRQPSSALVSPAAAVGALGELSPGGALMRGFQEQSLARKFFFLQNISVLTHQQHN